MSAFWYGMATSLSLIVAIGAQNAFVLKQGLKQQYVLWIVLSCALSDSILIFLGVTGFSKAIGQFPQLLMFAQYAGALFLFCYGLRSFYQALYSNAALTPSQTEPESLTKIMMMCLAFTWLNPHVYLDTVLLLGSISSQFTHQLEWFACGAILSSWLFFFSLGYGARLLQPIFNRPVSWKILDTVIGGVMWGIAWQLLVH
ncbi:MULTISPECIES: LysE/ArgO family amino acid transporter [Acinetobacter]|jgi:L-lysine exporter family protein LysE/ArgO|uniref:LysE/ArgO family amino acid transporter n=1 Tax=Acinetobacter TaxID=469 RepID=UPI00124E1628|nr:MULTISPECIES: LysE/ArgO family amino acid transporter [Acinetobacter]MCG2573528.1 LysE/ArgO family amino acid transporter [Acinetobacter sp. ME22]